MESFNLAAGPGVVGPRVPKGDTTPVEGEFQRHPAQAAVTAGVDGAVVGQHLGRVPISGCCLLEAGVDVGGFEHWPGDAGDTEPGVVIDDVEELHVAALSERPVSDVGLPQFVRLCGLEADIGALGPLVRLGRHEPPLGEDSPDRADRRAVPVAALEMGRDRRGTRFMPGPGEALRISMISSSTTCGVRLGDRSGRFDRGANPAEE